MVWVTIIKILRQTREEDLLSTITCLQRLCQLHPDSSLPLKIQLAKWILPVDSATLPNSLSTVEEIPTPNDPFIRLSVIMIWWTLRKASTANRRPRQAQGASYGPRICQDIRTTEQSFDFDLFNTYDKEIILLSKRYSFRYYAIASCIQVFYTCKGRISNFFLYGKEY